MTDNNKSRPPKPVRERSISYTAFENRNTLLHQALRVCQAVHDELDDSIKIKIQESRPKPSAAGLHRLKITELMKNIDERISSREIDSARNLYHYFISHFRGELKPSLGLPPLSVEQPPLELPHQDLLVTIINSAVVAEKFHENELANGWDNLAAEIKTAIAAAANSQGASLELVKLGKNRLNQLAKLISNTGGWEDGQHSSSHIWTQKEVDEAVPVIVGRDDEASLLMRFESFLKRCYPSINLPQWDKPPEVSSMTGEEIEAELAADFRNDFIIQNGIHCILNHSKQPPITREQAMEQFRRSWEPYGKKLHELIARHINHDDSPEDKLEQVRIAVNSHHQYVAKEGDHAQIEVCWKLVRWLRRTDLTWKDVERQSVK